MNRAFRLLLPALVLVVLLILAALVFHHPPEAERRAPASAVVMTVETMPLTLQDYQVKVQSYGTIRPRTQSMLMAEVSGQITGINASLRDGGFFEQGDVLLRIDARDYRADVSIAEASLADARRALAEEQARSEQARRDWERLGNRGAAPALVLREPQLLAAESRLLSAEAALAKARLGLERTQIIAPYAGRVRQKQVDVGQVVNPGSQLAEVYAADYVEVRLPIRNRDLPFLELPETYRDQTQSSQGPAVLIYPDVDLQQARSGRIVRTESAIDDNARQLHVVAQINDPFSANDNRQFTVKIGQYVTAEINGRLLPDALVIPNQAIYQGSYVYVVEDHLLQRRPIIIAWQNDKEAVIKSGLKADDALVLTPLGQVTSGIRVQIQPEAASTTQANAQ